MHTYTHEHTNTHTHTHTHTCAHFIAHMHIHTLNGSNSPCGFSRPKAYVFLTFMHVIMRVCADHPGVQLQLQPDGAHGWLPDQHQPHLAHALQSAHEGGPVQGRDHCTMHTLWHTRTHCITHLYTLQHTPVHTASHTCTHCRANLYTLHHTPVHIAAQTYTHCITHLYALQHTPVHTASHTCTHCITHLYTCCLLYTSPSPRDISLSRMPSSA